MKTIQLELPTFMFIIGTRAALAAGVALLLSPKIPLSRRRTIGSILTAIGATTTIPAARTVFKQVRANRNELESEAPMPDASWMP
ncbi:MAG TPA: hypothetical protein VEK56_07325 [Vicinamibacterales bacterium]|nr:hypothetical protein [Vicinamibacterales bacterium]